MVEKNFKIFKKARSKRIAAAIMCVCMTLSSFSNVFGQSGEPDTIYDGTTPNVTKMVADPNSMYSYNMIDSYIEGTGEGADRDNNGSRYAGRIWTDKSVIAYNDEQLTGNENGYKTFTFDKTKNSAKGEPGGNSIKIRDDFLHVFSALGSSVQLTGKVPTSTVIVIDNSGSMYGSAANWDDTRIAKTVSAVNRSIDRIMRDNDDNMVSVVLFGDGGDSGTNTAQMIIPMGHYPVVEKPEYSEDDGILTNPLPYLKAGWSGSTGGDDSQLDHTNKASGGWVYVNHAVLDDKKTGYDAYRNGTTNIQAGIQKGFDVLMNSPKTVDVDNITVNRIPDLIVLTDGAATDSLEGVWSNPSVKDGNYISKGFVNDFSDRTVSFVGWQEDNKTKTWNQFIVPYSEGTYEYRLLASDENGNIASDDLEEATDSNGGKYQRPKVGCGRQGLWYR